ncbi:P-loop containing nucleoside triphosphate hydrolase [Senna tora]|uniref:P-loop containing nucleoside triphosphate hydrolase n=1 Tax=Senna tora TaxID=362788 RepID=A0A835C8B1_9FABA|nr:P-loop containing nucleoside triphosphate hydrolase [Senna tora]
MKGHPGSGKSTLAHSIASSLRIPLIDKDDIRDSTVSLQHLPTPPPSSLLNDLSYDAIWRLASTQLRLGLGVVIDSPLSRRAHLDRLVSIAESSGARLVVVECKPSDRDEWRRRLERRAGSSHKPATWRDLERLVEEYGGCTEYDVGDVPKIVVDTTASVGKEEMCSGVVEFIAAHAYSKNMGQEMPLDLLDVFKFHTIHAFIGRKKKVARFLGLMKAFYIEEKNSSIQSKMENASEKMKFIEDPKARNETFLKLKAEMLKEVSELSAFYGAEFAIFFNLPSGETYAYGYPSVETIIDRYCSTNPITTEKEEEPHLQTTKSNSQTQIGSDKGKKRVLDMQDYDSGAQVEAENKKIKKLSKED